MEQSSSIFVIKGVRQDSIGNPVQIGSGPAAVIGDEICYSHCPEKIGREGAESRLIRKPEDLPCRLPTSCGVQ